MSDDAKHDELKDAIFYEAYIDKVVAGILGSLAWANSGLFNAAWQETFNQAFDTNAQQAGASWIYLFFILGLTYWISTWGVKIFRACLIACDPEDDDFQTINEQIEMKDLDVQAKSDAGKEDEEIPLVDNYHWLENTLQDEIKGVATTMVDLLGQTMAIIVGLAFGDATSNLAREIAGSSSQAKRDEIYVQWISAFLFTAFFLYLTVHYSQQMDDAQKGQIQNENAVDYQTENERAFWRLMKGSIDLCIAVSWRNAANLTVRYSFDEDGKDLEVLYGYAIWITVSTAVVFTLTKKYRCCVPISPQDPLQIGSQGRIFFTTTIGNAAKSVVGLAWIDCIQGSFATIHNSKSRLLSTCLYMLFAYAISILSELWIQDYLLKWAIEVKDDIVDFIDRFVDALYVGKISKDKSRGIENTSRWSTSLLEVGAELLLHATGMAAGWSVSPFMTELVLEIYGNKKATKLGSYWAAAFFSLFITALIGYKLGTIVTTARQSRKAAWQEIMSEAKGKKKKNANNVEVTVEDLEGRKMNTNE